MLWQNCKGPSTILIFPVGFLRSLCSSSSHSLFFVVSHHHTKEVYRKSLNSNLTHINPQSLSLSPTLSSVGYRIEVTYRSLPSWAYLSHDLTMPTLVRPITQQTKAQWWAGPRHTSIYLCSGVWVSPLDPHCPTELLTFFCFLSKRNYKLLWIWEDQVSLEQI